MEQVSLKDSGSDSKNLVLSEIYSDCNLLTFPKATLITNVLSGLFHFIAIPKQGEPLPFPVNSIPRIRRQTNSTKRK